MARRSLEEIGLMGFDTVLKRYFAGVILALIAIAAYFQASGITQLVGSALAPDDKSLAASAPMAVRPASAAAPRPEDHATSARWILERNPFDSVTPRPLDAPPSTSDAGAGSTVVDLEHYENAPPCDGFKALIIVASSDPAWSMAALSGGGAPATKL